MRALACPYRFTVTGKSNTDRPPQARASCFSQKQSTAWGEIYIYNNNNNNKRHAPIVLPPAPLLFSSSHTKWSDTHTQETHSPGCTACKAIKPSVAYLNGAREENASVGRQFFNVEVHDPSLHGPGEGSCSGSRADHTEGGREGVEQAGGRASLIRLVIS